MTVHRIRFAAAFAACLVFGLATVAAFAVVLRMPPSSAPSIRHATISGCSSVGCAQIGDIATYTLTGRVIAISQPQPGVICVQLGSASSAGEYCARSK